jgi:alpha-glucosidase
VTLARGGPEYCAASIFLRTARGMTRPWWQDAIIYQIYPRSFQDTNADGIGDLQGIVKRLDYLEWLGIDALWLSPIFVSPMADFGYDVSNYTHIDPIFGTLADFDALVCAAHRRRIRVLLDYVPNHTSIEHPWFAESRASRKNAKRDWYLWRPPAADGGPPNNWLSHFGGSAWTLDERTGEYYCHAFLPEQPDLNWREEQVQRAMNDVLRFWLDRGVDGFRVDVLWHLIKDAAFRDNPPNPDFCEGQGPSKKLLEVFSTDQKEVHAIVRRMRATLDEYGERVMIGEIYLPVDKLVTYYGVHLDEAHLPFNFQLTSLPWHAATIKAAVDRYEGALPKGAWPTWVLGNHDKSRVISRIGGEQARVAAVLLLTLRGTPTLYYGDELGMHDVAIAPYETQDPYGRNFPGLSRDPARTPMQWESAENAGFSSAKPWIKVADDAQSVNVASERQAPDSLLSLYHHLIHLRRAEAALTAGAYEPTGLSGDVFVYARGGAERRLLIALNFGSDEQRVQIDAQMRIGLSTKMDRVDEAIRRSLCLRPDEGVVLLPS